MTTSPVQVERRVGQRFLYSIPIALRESSTGSEGAGFSQDLSSRGVFFFTDMPLEEGAEVELTLQMPSEITLGESMPVRCRGRVLRVVRPTISSAHVAGEVRPKIGVAARLEAYEYLAAAPGPSPSRISSVHSDQDEDRPLAH
jgi:hypothetical protein